MSKDDRAAWLAGLKEGDSVITSNWGRTNRAIRSVTKATKVHIFVGSQRYLRRNGECRIDSWSGMKLEQPTPELVAEVRTEHRRAELTGRLNVVRWYEVSTTTLEKIHHLLARDELERQDEGPTT